MIGPRRASAYVVMAWISWLTTWTSFDDPLYQAKRWLEVLSRRLP